MRYTVQQDREEVEIQIEDVGDRAPALLQSFQECQSGHCSCPTDQYDRLAGMDVSQSQEALTLRLTAMAGQQFDVDELKTCLDHTIEKADASDA